MIVDFMEQAKTDTPHVPRQPKGLKDDFENALPLGVLGVLVHGWKNYTFVVPPWVGKGSDTIIECLAQVMAELPTPHAPKLFLQFDNCNENKSRAMMGFLGSLVHKHIFDEIEIGTRLGKEEKKS